MEHDHLNKLSITFQQKDQCEIWWKLAKWFLKNRDFIHVNSTVARKYYKYKNSAEGVIAPAGAKVTGATIRTWLLNKFISFLAVLTWKTGLKKM